MRKSHANNKKNADGNHLADLEASFILPFIGHVSDGN